MGQSRLASKLFAKTGLRVSQKSAENYLIRLRNEPGNLAEAEAKARRAMRGSQLHKKPAAADVDVVYADAASLVAHDVDARQWLIDDPTMFKTGLVRKFLVAKGLHLTLSVAETYLKRLKLLVKVSRTGCLPGLTSVAGDGDFELYMPLLRAGFAAESGMSLRRMQLALAEQGVKTTKSAMVRLLGGLKTEFYASKVDPVFRDYRCRRRCKQPSCGIDHSSFHRLESTLREQIALDPSIDAAGLLAFLGTLGYTVWCEPFMFPAYVDILKSVECAGRVLNFEDLRDYVFDMRKLLVDNLEISSADLLAAFNAAHGMCYLVHPQAVHPYLASIRNDITSWLEEARRCCNGPMSVLPPLDEIDARRGGANLHQHFLRQWCVTFCNLCGLRRFNGIKFVRKRDV